jgi:hypothetical protein
MSYINDSILILINVLHIIVILFIIGAPFSNSNYLLVLHIIVVPFIMLHWVLNNNTCCLTVTEKFIREKTNGKKSCDEECFSYQFIAPIYDFNKNYDAYSDFIYLLTAGLWGVSVFNLGKKIKNNEIKSIEDLSKL